MIIENFVVIEDDLALAGQFKAMLELESFKVNVFHSAEDYLLSPQSQSKTPYIYLIDLNLPGLAGSELIKVIRHKDKIAPVFIISGESPEIALKKCLDLGADDYLAKPYNPDHLILKIRNAQNKLKFLITSMIGYGVKLIPEANLISRDGSKLRLTGMEFAIIEKLLAHPDEVISRVRLIKEICGKEITERTVDVHVSNLRKKLIKIDLGIDTLRGMGYRIKNLEQTAVSI